MKPVVQCLFLAGEVGEVMLPPQRLRLRVVHGLLEDAWLREKLAQPAGDARGSVEPLHERLPVAPVELELRPVGKDAPCLGHRGAANEAAELRIG
jgi:hypothetical protein